MFKFAALSPRSFASRVRISCAARRVKVMARQFSGFKPLSEIKFAILRVKTVVFPDPGPATITSCFSSLFTAASCSSSSPLALGFSCTSILVSAGEGFLCCAGFSAAGFSVGMLTSFRFTYFLFSSSSSSNSLITPYSPS